MGIMAFLKTWRLSTCMGERPLAWAVRMKSCPRTSSVLARIRRARPAIPITPMPTAGMNILVSKPPVQPAHGTKWSLVQKLSSSTGRVIMMGIDMTTSVMVTIAGSIHEPCLCAMKNPRGSPMVRLIAMAAADNRADSHIFGRIRSRTGTPLLLKLVQSRPGRSPTCSRRIGSGRGVSVPALLAAARLLRGGTWGRASPRPDRPGLSGTG